MICPICFDTMSANPSTYGPKDECGDDHRAIVLACGHMIGKSCVELGDLDSCPFCRASLKHSRCSHRNKGMTVPWAIKDLNSIPQELSKGGIISKLCDSCRAQVILGLMMRRLVVIDEISQYCRNLYRRPLGMSIKLGGVYHYLGGHIDGKTPVLIETPAELKLEFGRFQLKQLQIENDGRVWFESSLGDAEIQCFTFKKSRMAEI